MVKRLVMLMMAAGLFICADNLQAQCAKGEKAACCASKKQTQSKISEVKTLNRDEVVTMIKANNVVVVDARDAESFTAGHIDGAVNYGKADLPADKNTKLIFYCGGEKCPAAARAARKAAELGYTNVMVYRGGWADWSKSSS